MLVCDSRACWKRAVGAGPGRFYDSQHPLVAHAAGLARTQGANHPQLSGLPFHCIVLLLLMCDAAPSMCSGATAIKRENLLVAHAEFCIQGAYHPQPSGLSLSRCDTHLLILSLRVENALGLVPIHQFTIRNTRWWRLLLNLRAHRACTTHSSQAC